MRLEDMTDVIRSKNSGPYELTFDFMFKNRSYFLSARNWPVFSAAGVCELLGISEADVFAIVWFEPSNALKITIRRPYPSGARGERDVYGAQQAAIFSGLVGEVE